VSNFQPWVNPDPQSVAGLNSQMVYGQNIQFAAGVNHQIAVGSNLQLCINPGTLVAMMGGPACSALSDFFGAGGLGGNTQFTIGTNTTINWGRQYQVNMGGETISFDANQQTGASKALCAIIGATCIAYSIAYGLCDDEDGRATIVIVFQLTVDLLLGAFMAYQQVLKSGHQSLGDMARSLCGAASVEHTSIWEEAGIMTAAAVSGVVGALVSPAVAVAVKEGHFASQQSQTQSAS
jgi:hypothetical protein